MGFCCGVCYSIIIKRLLNRYQEALYGCDNISLNTITHNIIVGDKLMNDTTIDSEILDIFKSLGIPEREGRILIVLNKYNDGLKQKDICVEGYLYQPEASVGLKSLITKKWVSIIDRICVEKKGRPYGIYALSKPFVDILNEIRENVNTDYEICIADIERLKEML